MSLAEELGYNFASEKCFEPHQIVDKQTGEILLVPCGKCLPCLRRRQSEWVVRLKEQLDQSQPSSCYFVTLTYDDEFVPVTLSKDQENEKETLDKRDFIAFFRRMRSLVHKGGFTWHDKDRFLPDQRIDLVRWRFKYYMTSEYGPKTYRPHAHMVFFDLDPDLYKIILLVQHCWPYGFTSVYPCSPNDPGFIGYVTKYLVNNMLSPVPGVLKPFSLMSKGLGLSYVDRMSDWHGRDLNRRYSIDDTGHKNILPRYWREAIYSHTERSIQADEIRRRLDQNAKKLEKQLTSQDLLVKFNEERKKWQDSQIYANLQLMLKKGKIK